MSLKKLIPASLAAIFVFTIVGQNFIAWRNTAYAQELINETITKIEAEPLTEEEKEAQKTIEILQKMKIEGELKYLGEEPYPPETENGPERKMQKFSFTDPDFSNDLIINVLDNNEISLMIDEPLNQSLAEDFEIKTDKEGNILNINEFEKKINDPNLKKAWLIEIIKINNSKLINSMLQHYTPNLQVMDDEYFEGMNLTEEEKKRQIEVQKKCDLKAKKVLDQLELLVNESSVIINGGGGGCGNSLEDFMFSISIFTITGQQVKTIEAQLEIQKIIDKLSTFKTASAQMKIRALEKALDSKNLRTYPNTDNTLFSFPYVGAGDNEELNISIDLEDKTENFISLRFTSEALGIIPGEKGEWIDVRIENDQISNRKELEEKFKDPNLKDELLLYIIQNQNKELLEGIKKYEIDQEDKFTPLVFRQYEVEGRNDLKLEIFNQLQEIVKMAEVPILERSMVPAKLLNNMEDWSVGEDQDPNVLYSFGIFPLGNIESPETLDAIKILDETISELKNSINSKNQSTIEVLKYALKADNLKYEGKDYEGSQELSFTNLDLSNDIILKIKKNGEVTFTIDQPFSRSMSERFQIEVNSEGMVLNLEELEKKLRDPNLTEPWLKELVKMHNINWLEENKVRNPEPYDEKYLATLSPEEKELEERFIKMEEKCSETAEKIVQQLEPLIKNAEVTLQPAGGGCDEKEGIDFRLSLFPITGQQAKNSEAKNQIEKIINKLSDFDTSSAQMKVEILQKALESEELIAYPNAAPDILLSFPYSGAGDDEILNIRADLSNKQEDFLNLNFKSEAFTKGKWVDIEIGEGEITNLEELKEKMADPDLKDPLIKFIIQNENLTLLESMKEYEFSEMEKMTPTIIKELEDLFKNAEVPIVERSETSSEWMDNPLKELGLWQTPEENILYSIKIFPMSS